MDSDSDGEHPAKDSASTSDSEQNSDVKEREQKLKYLTKLFPHFDNIVSS